MPKKKVVKKAARKKTVAKTETTCSTKNYSNSELIALAIIVLTWWKPAEIWSQITITVLAAIILLGNSCYKK